MIGQEVVGSSFLFYIYYKSGFERRVSPTNSLCMYVCMYVCVCVCVYIYIIYIHSLSLSLSLSLLFCFTNLDLK
jgi:hypothetical protein